MLKVQDKIQQVQEKKKAFNPVFKCNTFNNKYLIVQTIQTNKSIQHHVHRTANY